MNSIQEMSLCACDIYKLKYCDLLTNTIIRLFQKFDLTKFSDLQALTPKIKLYHRIIQFTFHSISLHYDDIALSTIKIFVNFYL